MLLKDGGSLIGLMGFQPHEAAAGEEIPYLLTENEPRRRVGSDADFIEAELTYALGRVYWKRGYATEMGSAMIRWGFTTLGIGRVIQGVLSSNGNSINLMRRLGFRIEQGLHGNTVGVLENS